MSTSTDSYDVVIVGGGIVGCAAARELAPDHDVLVLEKGQIAGHTTAKASGLISVIADYRDHLEAARYCLDFFDEYDGRRNFSYTRRDSLALVNPEREAAARADVERFADAGFDVSFRTPEEVEERHPGAIDLEGFVGAVEYREGGWVDPYTLAMTMKEDAEDDGAEFRTGVAVEAIESAAGEVTGVATEEGAVEASAVVCATGWRVEELVGEWIDVPVRPFRYQTINLETSREFEDDYPVVWEEGTSLYWRPEHNGDLHVGGGTYFVENPGDVRSTVTEEFRTLVADAVFDLVGNLEDARIVNGDTCPTGDSATPDERPLVDAPDAVPDGVVVATGAHGFGIMGSPAFGAAVRALVADEDASFPLEPYRLDRFDDGVTWNSDYIVEPDESLPQA